MALQSHSKPSALANKAMLLVGQMDFSRPASEAYPELIPQLEEEIAEFENRYGIPSSDISKLINSGVLSETIEVREWLSLLKMQAMVSGR